MAAKRLGFKPTMRETLLANERATRYYAIMAGKEPPESKVAPVKERAAPRQLEAPVVDAIRALLAEHPLVGFAVRQNTGAASYENSTGKWSPVKFYEHVTHSKRHVTVVDFWGFLKDGRMLAVEAKAPGWKKPTDDREFKQANFLALVRNCGGIGIFATSAEDVANALR